MSITTVSSISMSMATTYRPSTVPNEGQRARLPGYYMQNILSYYYIVLLGLSQWPSGTVRYVLGFVCKAIAVPFLSLRTRSWVYSTDILFSVCVITCRATKSRCVLSLESVACTGTYYSTPRRTVASTG
jgi:hypothetical protein